MKVDRAAIYEAAKTLSNWGRWGKDDQIGTLNNVSPDDLVNAGKLIKKGKVFSLGLSLKEPIQSGLFGGRWNPIHTMLATGTDAVAGNQDVPSPYLRYADDAINMPCQASTQWDALCHIFLDDKMYNGYDATLCGRPWRQEARHRTRPRQDGRPRRAARYRALQGRRFAR
ncbi:hypothetical protein V1282_007369 [Nitrobacteraceae bacterium AZCC 2146]